MNKSSDKQSSRYFENKDALYLAAVSKGDMQTAERIVNETARDAGYAIMAWHGSQSARFTEFDSRMIGATMGKKPKDQGFWFSSEQSVAEEFSAMNPTRPKGWVKKFYLKFNNLAVWNRETELQGPAVIRARKQGADGVLFKDVWDGMTVKHDQYLVFSATQIKPAEIVLVDKKGKLVPLSQRF